MATLILRGTTVEKVDFEAGPDGLRKVTIKMAADWSKKVCDDMGWSHEPIGFENGSLEGELDGSSLVLEPNKGELKDYRFELPIGKVQKFKHIVETKKDGEGGKVKIVGRRVGFSVVTTAPDALTWLDQWVTKCGPGAAQGQCKITHTTEEEEEDKQGTLVGTEATKRRGRQKEEPAQ